jgi:S-formylglutathione hydrolase FrmB
MRACLRTVAPLLFALAFATSGTAQTKAALPPLSHVQKAAQVNVAERVFHSASLGRDSHYYAMLPADYAHSQKRYPVLYLLHGWHGDYTNWVKLTNLVEYARRYPIIIITPDAENSWYVNSATMPQNRFEDFVTKDLIEEVDSHWRTIASPHRRAIAGLSMGGYGAILFALKHPNLFAFAGSISGAFEGPNGIDVVLPELQESLQQAYGPAGSSTREENDVYALAPSANADKLPYLFLDCGTQDPLLASNRKFVDILSGRKIPYEYHEYPGSHTWSYWDHSLPMLLDIAAKRIVTP